MEKKVVYIFDANLAAATDRIPHLQGRAHMVHELIRAYGLLEFMDVRPSLLASNEDLLSFHSSSYLEYLEEKGAEDDEDVDACIPDSQGEEFGLGYDCPTFYGMLEFAKIIAGGTLAAVNAIIDGSELAINWCGGWHHAQRDEASGFCYVNDIVIGIQKLMQKFKRVLYIDLDSHHGDGVENAFSYSNRVTTLSLHHLDAGYFPGTGTIKDMGFGKGRYHAMNVPFKSGVTDDQFVSVFNRVYSSVIENFSPDVIVVQCGCDCMTGDPLGNFNLTEVSLTNCAKTILSNGTPKIFLGGGGYNLTNAAKAWTSLTSVIIGKTIETEIPDNAFFTSYGPDFTIHIPAGLRRNENDAELVNEVVTTIQENATRLKSPS